MKELLNTYYPIEIDASRSPEEKLPLMVEWWTKVHELLIQQKIRKDMLPMAVKESNVMLREGYKVFFDHLSEHQVPLLILSAGVGDVLEEVIRQNHVFHPNIHVISNYVDFDHTFQVISEKIVGSFFVEGYQQFRPHLYVGTFSQVAMEKGVLRAFKGQMMHTFNKSEGALSQAAGLRQLQGRPNVLLLGDSLRDLTMADGVSEPKNILTIGFLNDQVSEGWAG